MFVARACGIPTAEAASLDAALLEEVKALFAQPDLDVVESRRVFLAGKDMGFGFQSVELCGPAAHAASWHACLPSALRRLQLPAASALTSLSPWARSLLPGFTRTLQASLRDETACIGDENLTASQHLLA